MTINEAMVYIKIIRERLTDLKSLRVACASRTTYMGVKDSTVEPQYDVKKVDKKITELQNFLAIAEAKIKTSNSRTDIGLDIDMEKILAPLE